MNKKGAIIQPSYLPWPGYFSIIKAVDQFIFLDDVQFDKRGWRNRNKIRTSLKADSPAQWITVPVESKGKYDQLIKDTKIAYDQNWERKQLQAIQMTYSKAKYYNHYIPQITEVINRKHVTISSLDIELTRLICEFLGISTPVFLASELINGNYDDPIDRLIALCKILKINHYISGPSAKDYIKDSPLFENNQILLEYFDYTKCPFLNIQNPVFNPHVTILDLLFQLGPKAGTML